VQQEFTIMATIKVKSTDKKSQGDFVVIEEADFDPEKHEKLTDKQEAAAGAKTAAKDKE
jgi:hypothetical protein